MTEIPPDRLASLRDAAENLRGRIPEATNRDAATLTNSLVKVLAEIAAIEAATKPEEVTLVDELRAKRAQSAAKAPRKRL
jgi:hypothetical protein